MIRVLGFDPGLKITGFGVIELKDRDCRVVQAGVIKARVNKDLALRLQELYLGLREIIEEAKPDEIAVEELYSHYQHPRTAILMGHARGLIYLLSAEEGIPIVSYSAKRIKKSLTGNGSASKLQVQRVIQARLALPTLPEPNDVADALAVALCHINCAHRVLGGIIH